MERLKWLIENCKAEVSINCNTHRNEHQSAKDYLEQCDRLMKIKEDIFPGVWNKMITSNTIIEVRAYPQTSIGFYHAYHYDLESALEEVIHVVTESKE